MNGYERNDVLERVDLTELADELLGGHTGSGRSAMWSCPLPTHAQTGKTPPVNIFRSNKGGQRWHCHGCGEGGTAIDLVMIVQGVDFRNALELLGQRSRAPHVQLGNRSTLRAPKREPDQLTPNPLPPEVMRYVAACEERLWSDKGRPVRQYLAERGFGDEILRANRVGADPGPGVLPRAEGLPRRGAAVVFPVWHENTACYLQVRYLADSSRRYENPSSHLVGVSPRLAELQAGATPFRDDRVLVCEGMPDALTAAQAGERSVAILGAGYPDERVALELVRRFGDKSLVLAFDADERGVAGAGRLTDLLSSHDGGQGRTLRLNVPSEHGDLNKWRVDVGEVLFRQEIDAAVTLAGTGRPSLPPPPSSQQTVGPYSVDLSPTLEL